MGPLALVKRESLARHRTAQQCQNLTQTGWPDAPESVAGSDWNGWPDQIGIPGRMSPECATHQLMLSAKKKWRKLDGQNRLPDIIQGVEFRDGIKHQIKAA